MPIDFRRFSIAPGIYTEYDAMAIPFAVEAGKGNAIIYLPPGIFPLTTEQILQVTAGGSIQLVGAGPGATIIKRQSGTVTKGGNIFNCTGQGSFVFRDLTIDANGAGQDFSTSTTNDFYKAITGDGNAAGGNSAILVVDNVQIINTSMSLTNPNGLAINTFGLSTQYIRALSTSQCDCTLFVTQPFANSPNQTFFDGIFAHNPTIIGVEMEGTGGVTGKNLQVYSDAPSNATGLRILTAGQDVLSVVIDGARFEELGFPVLVGGGTQFFRDSILGNMVARNCKGSYNLSKADSSCEFHDLIAHSCGGGGIPSTTVFGSFEIGVDQTSDLVYLHDCHSIGSGNNGFNLNGPAVIDGGSSRNSTGSNVNFSNATVQQLSKISRLNFYNPVGAKVTAVPPSTTAFTNPYGSEATVYITAGGGTCAVAIGGSAVLTLAAGDTGSFRVPPGVSITLTYASAPTWAWMVN